MLKNVPFLFLLSFILLAAAGCQTADTARPSTPTAVIQQSTATPAATLSEASVEPTPFVTSTETVAVAPVLQITPEPDSNPTEMATEMPTATPTETPIPSSPVSSITLAPIIEGAFIRPLYLTHAGDDRLFVVEQAGVIRIIQDGTLLDSPFLDIRDRVGSTQLEQGLLGLAFHPNYADSGVFFVNYTNTAGDSINSRFTVDANDPNHANNGSETQLLTYKQPYPNHNSGQIAFGPDGYLYIGVGDGGSANDPLGNGQDPGTLLGTILRLDVDPDADSYSIPDTNPFVGNGDQLNEIWAWGLRNPWRFSFDRLTGDLFIADVGQNLWEEVHFQPAESAGGENYGWNILEGSNCFPSDPCDSAGLELPIFEYTHQEGCSITGGYMYRGSQYPELYGNYLVADYCQGTIWRLFPESSGDWSSSVVYDSTYIISSFGEDAAGELYVLDHTGGSLYQIKPE